MNVPLHLLQLPLALVDRVMIFLCIYVWSDIRACLDDQFCFLFFLISWMQIPVLIILTNYSVAGFGLIWYPTMFI